MTNTPRVTPDIRKRIRLADDERDHLTVLDWALLDWAYNWRPSHPPILSRPLACREGVSVTKLVALGAIRQTASTGVYRFTERLLDDFAGVAPFTAED